MSNVRLSPSRRPLGDPAANAKQAAQVIALLDRLDSIDDSKFRNRRSASRVIYRRTSVPVHIHHPGGSACVRAVATRNISASGIGFIYPSFLHAGTRAEVQLERLLGGTDLIRGQVVFCSHAGGVFHQVGVRFDGKIFPKLYVEAQAVTRADESTKRPEGDKGSIGQLTGNVMLIDDQAVDRALMGHHLRDTSIRLTAVADEKQALKALQSTEFTAVFCDLNLETSTGEATIHSLRRAGYHGPICLVTAERARSRIDAALRAGAVAVLQKPYDQASLLAMLSRDLTARRAASVAEKLVSTLPLTPATEATIARYVSDVNEAAEKIRSAMLDKQLEVVRQLCLTLRGSGTTYGFSPLHEAAREALRVLEASASVDESEVQVRALTDLCRRVALRR